MNGGELCKKFETGKPFAAQNTFAFGDIVFMPVAHGHLGIY